MTILDMAHDYITQSRKRLLLILSYSPANVTRYLRGERSFDQSLIDYLQSTSVPLCRLEGTSFGRVRESRIIPEGLCEPILYRRVCEALLYRPLLPCGEFLLRDGDEEQDRAMAGPAPTNI